MVHELHKAGYQRLRICAGLSPSGCHWRCKLIAAANVKPDGWRIDNMDQCIARYSTGSDDHYFDWSDSPGKSARQLAQMFIDRNGEKMRECAGRDWPYVAWFVEMLGAAEHGKLPVFFADYELTHTPDELPPPP